MLLAASPCGMFNLWFLTREPAASTNVNQQSAPRSCVNPVRGRLLVFRTTRRRPERARVAVPPRPSVGRVERPRSRPGRGRRKSYGLPQLRISLKMFAVKGDGRLSGSEGISDKAGENMDHGVPGRPVA